MGVNYVFDTTFSADLTIMEEGNEFLERLKKGETKVRPMFTSCCPGWIRFIKSKYPHLVPQLSTAKSPQQMFGSVMKTYFAENLGVDPEQICTISVMPCVAKKGEADMEFFYKEYAGHETDIVLTTRELDRMIRSAHLAPELLEDIPFDSLMKEGSGAGVIFGTTGGVMEAAVRTAYYLVHGKNPDADAFQMVRNSRETGITEAKLSLAGMDVELAVVCGLGNVTKLLDRHGSRQAIDCRFPQKSGRCRKRSLQAGSSFSYKGNHFKKSCRLYTFCHDTVCEKNGGKRDSVQYGKRRSISCGTASRRF